MASKVSRAYTFLKFASVSIESRPRQQSTHKQQITRTTCSTQFAYVQISLATILIEGKVKQISDTQPACLLL